jgi:hypothetical protein
MPRCRLEAERVRRIRAGQRVTLAPQPELCGALAVLDERGELVALGATAEDRPAEFVPHTVFQE